MIAYDDQDFPKSFPYVFKIPSDESSVDINKVVELYEKLIYSHPDYSIDMREYAEEHLSWDAKMKPVIEVIEQIALQKKRIRVWINIFNTLMQTIKKSNQYSYFWRYSE